MNKLITAIKSGAVKFARDEEGAQVVEYALIIAVISIGLILTMQSSGLTTGISTWVGRIVTCLGVGPCV